MDFPKPVRLPKNYYFTQFHRDSKSSFMSLINERCQDKEDATACVEKYGKAFDSVFDHLKTKLEEEDRATYYFDKRLYNGRELPFSDGWTSLLDMKIGLEIIIKRFSINLNE